MAAAALEEITLHPGDEPVLSFRVILLLGLGLYLAGVEGSALRAYRVFPPERATAVLVLAALLLLGGSLDGLVLLVLIDVVIFVTLVAEGIRLERPQPVNA